MGTAQGTIPAGWYSDPERPGSQRWWDGTAWTEHRHPPAPPPPVAYSPAAYAPATNGIAVTSLVLGLVGIVVGFVPILFWLAWGLGVAAFVTGLVAVSKAKALGGVRKTMAVWGVIVGIGAFGMGVVGYAYLNDAFSSASKSLNDTTNCLKHATTPEQVNAC